MLFYNNKIMGVVDSSAIYKSQNTLLNGLVSYWDFNSDANDRWVNGNDGSVTSATFTTDGGILNNAYLFDGTDDYIEIPGNPASLNPQFGISISVWFKPTATPTLNTVILAKYDSGNNKGYQILYRTDNTVSLLGRNDSTAGSQIITSTESVTLNTWNNVVIILDELNWKFYLNDSFIGEIAWANGGDISTIYNLTFGDTTDPAVGGNRHFQGYLDEIGYWDRILTESEIEKIFNNGIGITFSNLSYIPKFWREPETYTPKKIGYNLLKDLVSYWSFDSNANDVHRTNNGTVTSATPGQTGIINQCYLFDGTDDYIEIPGNPASLNPQFGISISVWFKPTATPTTNTFILAKYKASENKGYNIQYSTTNTLVFSGRNNSTDGFQSISSSSITLNTWNNAVIILDELNWKFYLNGSFVDEIVWTNGGDISNTNLFKIGDTSDSTVTGNRHFSGYIDEIGYWVRILSEDEPETLYNKASGLPYENMRY
jgi:hypothetical protein